MTRLPVEPLRLDSLIRAGAVHSMTGDVYRSVGVRGAEIVAVSGELDGLDDLAGSDTVNVDAGDLTLLAAFDDSHEHLLEASRNTLLVPVDQEPTTSQAEGPNSHRADLLDVPPASTSSVKGGDILHPSVTVMDEHLARPVLTGDTSRVLDRVVELRVEVKLLSTPTAQPRAVVLFDDAKEVRAHATNSRRRQLAPFFRLKGGRPTQGPGSPALCVRRSA
jgi:hypothetical protein